MVLGTAGRKPLTPNTAVAKAGRRRLRSLTPATIILCVVSFYIATSLLRTEPPAPTIHDEHINILIADTLLQGRLAMPTHRFADHFETVYVLQRPAYAGKYPIGTGALLAIGKLLTGHVYGGIAVGAVCALLALYWAFSALVPSALAAAGAS